MSLSLTLFGQTPEGHDLSRAVLGSVVFGLIGIGLLIVGYFLFDLLTRRLDIQEQLNKGNTAVAIVVGALLLAIAYITAHVVL
jgi:putative membrane protein